MPGRLVRGVRRRVAPVVVLIATTACDSPSTSPDSAGSNLTPSLARGGIPGPPGDVVLPGHIGPPLRVPVTLPPNAGPPSFLSNVISVGAGASYSCALREDGAAFCWGNNSGGQLGDGTLNSSAIPVAVAGGHRFTQIFVGDVAACALTAVGEAYCWGLNFQGQLGTGAAQGAIAAVPTPVAGNLRFRTLGVGLVNTCGIATDGTVWCWGRNNHRQLALAVPLNELSLVPIPIPATAPLALITLDVGNWAVCGLDAAQALYCWGSKGDAGNGPGGEDLLEPTRSGNGELFSAVSLGSLYSCGLAPNGQARCWGQRDLMGEQGQGSARVTSLTPAPVLGAPRVLSSIDADDNNASAKTTCGLTPAGEAWCWGSNETGQLGATSTEMCVFTSSLTYACSPTPLRVTGGISFRQVAVGDSHTCGLATDGAVYCWGWNAVGQLGTGTLTDSSTPVRTRRI